MEKDKLTREMTYLQRWTFGNAWYREANIQKDLKTTKRDIVTCQGKPVSSIYYNHKGSRDGTIYSNRSGLEMEPFQVPVN